MKHYGLVGTLHMLLTWHGLQAMEQKPLIVPVDQDLQLELGAVRHAPELFAILEAYRATLSLGIPMVCKRTTTLQATQALLQTTIDAFATKERLFFVIMNQVMGMIGAIWLHSMNKEAKTAQIGAFVIPAVQQQGIMKRVGPVFLDYCFETWGLNKLFIECAVNNQGSKKLAAAGGFTLEIDELAEAQDDLLYGLLKSTWQKQSK